MLVIFGDNGASFQLSYLFAALGLSMRARAAELLVSAPSPVPWANADVEKFKSIISTRVVPLVSNGSRASGESGCDNSTLLL